LFQLITQNAAKATPESTGFGARNKDRDLLTVGYRLLPGYRIRRYLSTWNNRQYFVAYLAAIGLGALLCLPLILWKDQYGLIFAIWDVLLIYVSLIVTIKARKDRLCLDSKQIYLPANTHRLGRIATRALLNTVALTISIKWHRVREISIVDNGKTRSKPDFALRFGAQYRTFTGDFDLPLRGLQREDLPKLIDHIEKYCAHAKGLYLLKELIRFYDFQEGRLLQTTYTELWESTHRATFSLTSFNPLPADSEIQGGAFRVVKQLGAGGFAAVYLIKDRADQLFVLKESVLPPTLSAESMAKAREQFQREALLLTKLDHLQIAQVFDHFTENERNYLRLEYVAGKTLRQLVNDLGVQNEDTVLRWCRELAGILKYLHGLTPPVMHRDLAPDNIIVSESGRLVLIDFGAANEFVGAATGTLVGRHAYMAPEQIRGKAEPASDIYSLGATLFFCLTGKDPAPLSNCSPLKAGAKVTPRLEELVRLSTKLDSEERFRTAKDVLEFAKGKTALNEEIAS
jgi:predicted Ser/Thr protein kinase